MQPRRCEGAVYLARSVLCTQVSGFVCRGNRGIDSRFRQRVLARAGSLNGHLQSYRVIGRVDQILPGAQITLGGLDRRVAKQ